MRQVSVIPGDEMRVFCPQHDEHKARYHCGRPMLDDTCPMCSLLSAKGAAAFWRAQAQGVDKDARITELQRENAEMREWWPSARVGDLRTQLDAATKRAEGLEKELAEARRVLAMVRRLVPGHYNHTKLAIDAAIAKGATT